MTIFTYIPRLRLDTRVRRPFTSDPNRIYTYETDANTWYLQATLGWQWLQRPSFSLTPKGKLAYFNYSQSAYLENRPELAPSSVDAYSNGYTQADLLLDFQLFFSNQLTLNTSVGYRGLVGADGAVMTSSADGVSYNVNGVSAAEHQFVLDIGSVFEINRNALLTTEYNFRTGQGSHLHGGTGSLVLTF